MTLIELFPDYRVERELDLEQQSWVIARAYGLCQGWRVNLVVDESGETFGQTGSSDDISNGLDRAVLAKLRSLSDVIVTSGKTARAEKYKSSKHAPIAIFTRSGDLDGVPAIQGQQFFTPLVIAPMASRALLEESLEDVDAKLLTYSEQIDSWPVATAELLRHEGFQSPLLESGRDTISEYLAAGVISEVCLTITHGSSKESSARELNVDWLAKRLGPMVGFQLANAFAADGTVFARWRRGS